MGSGLCIDISQISRVLIGNDEQMARIDRLNIEKGGTLVIAIDYTRWDASV